MPALRERSEDIPILVESLLLKIAGSAPAEVVRTGVAGAFDLRIPRQCARAGEHPRACDGAFSSSIIDVPDLQLAPKPMPESRPPSRRNAR